MQIEGHYAIWALPSQKLNLPLNVRSVGRNDVSAGWRDKVKQKWFLQLFWTVEGNAEFLVGAKRYRVKAGDIFIYRPGDRHEITSLSKDGYAVGSPGIIPTAKNGWRHTT